MLLTTHDLPRHRAAVGPGRGGRRRPRLVYAGDLAGLAREVGAQRVLVVDLTEPAPPLAGVPGTRLVEVEAGGLRQHLELTGSAAAAVAAVSARAPMRDLTIAEPDIEDVVARIYRRGAAT